MTTLDAISKILTYDWPLEIIDYLHDRSFYTRAQQERLRQIDHLGKIGAISLDGYEVLLLHERFKRQAECDSVAAELLATVNLGDRTG